MFTFVFICWKINRTKHPYHEAAEILAHHWMRRFSSIPFQSDLLFALSPLGFENRKALRITHDYSSMVIAERKRAIEAGTDKNLPGNLMPFLDTLLKAKVRLYHTFILDNISCYNNLQGWLVILIVLVRFSCILLLQGGHKKLCFRESERCVGLIW